MFDDNKKLVFPDSEGRPDLPPDRELHLHLNFYGDVGAMHFAPGCHTLVNQSKTVTNTKVANGAAEAEIGEAITVWRKVRGFVCPALKWGLRWAWSALNFAALFGF